LSRFQPNLAALNEIKWVQFLEQVKEIDLSAVSSNATFESEFDRLVRITEYISGVVGSTAPFADFLNPDINNLVTMFENRLIQVKNTHPDQLPDVVSSLNDDATKIVDRISPFVANLESARAAGQAFGRYKKRVELEEVKLQEIRSKANNALVVIQDAETEVTGFRSDLLEGTDDSPSTKGEVQEATSNINKMLSETESFYKRLTEGDSESASIQNQISQAKADAITKSEEIAVNLLDASSKLKKLERVYQDIVGQTVDGETTVKGLEEQLQDRKGQLDSLVEGFDSKFKGLFEQIEGLLPGATSAGLATAYNDLSVDAKKRAMRYSIAFFVGIFALTLSAAVTVTQSFTLWPLKWDLITIADAGEYLNKMLFKLPVVIPVLWFTLTVSKRRSEMQRLAEEYAHKEALAKSYEGFKKQIVELKKDGDPLLSELLEVILKAISVNSAKTLEGKHGEKMPIQEVVEETVKKVLNSGS